MKLLIMLTMYIIVQGKLLINKRNNQEIKKINLFSFDGIQNYQI